MVHGLTSFTILSTKTKDTDLVTIIIILVITGMSILIKNTSNNTNNNLNRGRNLCFEGIRYATHKRLMSPSLKSQVMFASAFSWMGDFFRIFGIHIFKLRRV